MISFVQNLHDLFVWRGLIFCEEAVRCSVARLRVFCCCWSLLDFFGERIHDFFVERFLDIFVERLQDFCVERLHDFFVERVCVNFVTHLLTRVV